MKPQWTIFALTCAALALFVAGRLSAPAEAPAAASAPPPEARAARPAPRNPAPSGGDELAATIAALQPPEPAAAAGPSAPVDPPEDVDGDVWASEMAYSLDESLAEQSVDTEWSRAMDERITYSFRAPALADIAVERKECRSSLCRVDLRAPDLEARERLVQLFTHVMEPGSQGFLLIESDDDLEVNLYMTRAGVALPDVPIAG
jgi:hypothetical protein